MADRGSDPEPGTGWRWLGAGLIVASLLTFLSTHHPCGRAAVLGWTAAGVAWAASVRGGPPSRGQRWWLGLSLLLSYGMLLAAPPRFSDDLWRYLFDGKVGAMGLNPFAYAPANPKVAYLAPDLVARMNFPEMRTIYPPLAQALFTLASLAGADDRGWRFLLVVVALGAAAWAARDTGEDELAAHRFWSIAAAPLVVVSAGSLGALDVTGLVVGTALLSRSVASRVRLQGLWVGVGAGIKLFPALLFATLPASKRLRSGLAAAFVAASLLVLAYLPIAGIGSKALGSLATYSTRWSFNGGPVRWTAMVVEATLRGAGVTDAVEIPLPTFLQDEARRVVDGLPTGALFVGPDELARGVATLLGLIALVAAVLRARRRLSDPAALAAATLLAFFATQFTVYPWYGLWLLPASVLLRGRGGMGGAALAWCALLPLALLTPASVVDGGIWAEPLWVTPLLWSAVFAGWWQARHRV